MARQIPADRLEQLVDCAANVFIDQGYRHTQMADVAEAMGVAKGTLYLYVQSKEALFDLVCRYADTPRPFATRPALPVRAPRPGATVKYVRDELARNQVLPTLAAAVSHQRVTDVRREAESIIRELYDTLARHRCGLKLIDRSARDLPELAALWFEGARGGLIQGLSHYLQDRIRRKLFHALPDTTVAARLIIETTVFWAVHRHWDAHPQAVDDATAQGTVIHFLVGALVKE